MISEKKAVIEKYLPAIYGILTRTLDRAAAARALEEIFTTTVFIQDDLTFWIQATTKHLRDNGTPKQQILLAVIPPKVL
ncbi:hypothetical protein [Chitinophaga barathri]|uniref:Uncharacterized protein n=1 Tax=Chitinophaga barathri TaxID=1647451 RepID=A0A3N4MGH6_9BACT|nr:hypothetical protein [Chitinophaga barathri]RPD43064.1 hypothetical protein EG028_01875 [Chitinophaga barathri]